MTGLADANRERPSQFFADLFSEMLSRARRGARKEMTETLVLLDSTCVPLHALSQSLAPDKKRAGACAMLHGPQIIVALIAYLLIRMAHRVQTAVRSLLRFTKPDWRAPDEPAQHSSTRRTTTAKT